eukprot:5007455-Ditylum_brightwellii.AAC.1
MVPHHQCRYHQANIGGRIGESAQHALFCLCAQEQDCGVLALICHQPAFVQGSFWWSNHAVGDEEEEDGLQVLLGPHMAQTLPTLSKKDIIE